MNYSKIQQQIRPMLEAANINADSFLATDYLNHFNEIVMLLEMVPDMPDMAEDCMDWEPASYEKHFEESGFAAKDLAIEAYHNAPTQFKEPFDRIINELDAIIEATLNGLRAVNVAERGVSPQAASLISNRVAQMQDYLAKMNRLIHGSVLDEETIKAADITDEIETSGEETQSQADIDALFD